MKFKYIFIGVAGMMTAVAAAAAPSVTIRSCEQSANNTVTLAYTLSGGPAVITLGAVMSETLEPVPDAEFSCVTGAVNRKVTSTSDSEVHTIVWSPTCSRSGRRLSLSAIRPVVTAWPTNDPPDYMVVDLAESSVLRTRYYTSTNALPGGLLANRAYRTSLLVLRKIPAKGVTWMMGSENEAGRNPDAAAGADPEKMHEVHFDKNYYMGIFPVTQEQWILLKGTGVTPVWTYVKDRMMRPMDSVSYCLVRENASNAEDTAHQYPEAPHPDSFLGVLRARTGIDFDLPSDAEWEYACRAGWGENTWGNGEAYECRWEYDARVPGRYKYNQANTDFSYTGSQTVEFLQTIGATNATAVVGSYAPNSWGLYDMHGNVFEWCLDWYKDDITSLGGDVNVANGKVTDAGVKFRVRRGGAWGLPPYYFRSACRYLDPATSQNDANGFRVACPAQVE